MKRVLTALTAMSASPALAHSGVHVHLHATNSSLLPLLTASLFLAYAAALIAVSRT